MTDLAALSRVLYSPTTIALYFAAAFTLLYALTMSVGRHDQQRRGELARRVGGGLAVAGITTHVAHEITRGIAQQRLPLGNMFEVTSLMALVGVVAGLSYLTWIRRRGDLNGFVLLLGGLLMAFAGLLYAEPGPLMPILDTWWRPFHVSLLVTAMGIFAAGFVFNALFLLRDTAELSVAGARTATTRGSTVGAASIEDLDDIDAALEGDDDRVHDVAYRAALRAGVPAGRLAVGTFVGASTVSWVFLTSAPDTASGLARFFSINLALVAAALLARWLVPFVPSTVTLDGLAHRTIAFAFILWTVGTIAGAMWAEQSWGRFWGWDPKETGAFLTWVAYAGYLHARATRGIKGRPAAWIGIGAFVVMMGTYLIANYVIVGLHSYAGL
ncbi:MAG: cytochrome c biogenesis protein CcsA [Nitriliruptoraceae bacterium]